MSYVITYFTMLCGENVKNYMSIYVMYLCFMYVATVLYVLYSFVRETSPVCLVQSRAKGMDARACGNSSSASAMAARSSTALSCQ